MPSSSEPARGPVPAPPPAERTWTVWSAQDAVDVAVRAPDDAGLADVLGPLAAALGRTRVELWSGAQAVPAATPLTAETLRHGAALGLDRPGPTGASDSRSGVLELHVVSGPDTGRRVPLEQGSLVVGRGGDCGLAIADPDVSRQHATVTVAEGRVVVADQASSNGSTLTRTSGPPAVLGAEPQEWPVGGVLRIGASALRLTGPRGTPLDTLGATAGRHVVRPLSIRSAPAADVVVPLPAPPPERTPRRLGWVAIVLPAVAGVTMAWLLSTPQFLFFALLGPLTAVASWASDRVTGRRSDRRTTTEHAAACAAAAARLDAAVAADRATREEHQPDTAGLAAAARRRCSPLWSRDVEAIDGLAVRLGTGSGPTAVSTTGPDGARSPVPADHLPVTLSLGAAGGLAVVGPREPGLGALRSVLCQLAALTSPADLQVLLVCSRARAADWRWARWLPHLRAVVVPGEPLPAAAVLPAGQAGPWTVLVLDGPAGVAGGTLTSSARLVRLEIADSEAALTAPAPVRLAIGGETGTTGCLRVAGRDAERQFVLDRVSGTTAAGLARDLTGLAVPAGPGELPDTARLLELPLAGLRLASDDTVTGQWDRSRSRLRAVLGTTGRELVTVDLVADGPHALAAGTTGSGKSELLQTLVASLALAHPPDRCSFLLVDYKGGAAFGEAAALPHTVGVLTDLDHQSTARALRSLAAELTRRERLLAEHRVRDLADLPAAVPLGRLVIVVDEFATLAEELPGFVPGLVGIAQRGRSLGVHLVLATQRPSGVVSPEIRANSSLRICLRTTDEGDARDVLGSAAPAALPSDRPGRAYLRRGSSTPVLLQVARVSGTRAEAGPPVTVHPRSWPPPPNLPPGPRSTVRASDLRRVVAALADRAAAEGLRVADRPWLPPLPDRLAAAELDRCAPPAEIPTVLRIGLLDHPDAQLQRPLELDLAAGGGWLVVGGPRSGRTTALRTVLAEAARQLPPSRLHVHVLDHAGGALARMVAALPHCGTVVERDDAHRSVRLLARLGEEVDRRRTADGEQPLLLLLIDGHESLAAQLEDAAPATGGAPLLRLVREGAAVGVTVVLTAHRAVPGSRVSSAMRSRVVLPLADRADYTLAGVPGPSVPGHRPPGRALVGEDAVECQLALPREGAPEHADTRRTAPAIRIPELPADPVLPLPTAPPSTGGVWLPLGPGGDDGAAVGLDLDRAGGLLVVGPPGSGRSTSLRAFARHCRAAGAAVVELVDGATPTDGAGTGEPDRVARDDPAALRAWAGRQESQRPVVAVVDDLGTLPDAVGDALTALVRPAGRLLLLAAGTAADLGGAYRGPVPALRRTRTALFLRPAAGDAELFGLRTPRTPLPSRPGAGWLMTATHVTRVQVARHRRSPL